MPFAPATKDEYVKSLKRYLSWRWEANQKNIRRMSSG